MKNPPNAPSIATVTSSKAKIPACVPFVIDELGLPKQTGHASAGDAIASNTTLVSVIPILFLIPNP